MYFLINGAGLIRYLFGKNMNLDLCLVSFTKNFKNCIDENMQARTLKFLD